MNPSSVQQTGIVTPWRQCLFFLSHCVEVGGAAAVGAAAWQALQIAMLLQFTQSPLDRTAGQVQVCRNGLDAGPTLPLGIAPIPQVHIDRPRPVW